MVRTIDFKYTVLRNGSDYCPLYALSSGAPTLRMSASGEIKTSLSGDFLPAAGVDWLSDEIRPELWIDGIRHPLGIYLPATVREAESEGTARIHVECYDRGWRVKDTATQDLLHLSAGTLYMTAVEQLLTAAGIGLVISTPTDAVLAEDREDWDVGTSYLKIINQLLSEINYKQLWFNDSGAAILEPASVPTSDQIDHVLDADNVRSLLIPSYARESDIFKAPNVFICICSNPDKSGAMVATAENTNVLSPLSIPRRGRRICKVVRVNNTASQEDLQAYADRLCSDSLYTGDKVAVQTALLPGYGVQDVVALHYGDQSGIYLESAWSMQLQVGGTMSHTLERVVFGNG